MTTTKLIDLINEDLTELANEVVTFVEQQSKFNASVEKFCNELKAAMLDIATDVDKLNAESTSRFVAIHTPKGGNGGIH